MTDNNVINAKEPRKEKLIALRITTDTWNRIQHRQDELGFLHTGEYLRNLISNDLAKSNGE